jgi:hypothetical protein
VATKTCELTTTAAVRPGAVLSLTFYIGNQLFRADRLTRGYVLYRDIASQFGPVPAYL